MALIVAEEDVSEAWYAANAAHPVWPGGASGVTIGIGYDLGQQTASQIAVDWEGRLSADDVTALIAVAGLKGRAASARLPYVRHVIVPWSDGIAVFRTSTLPRYAEGTENVLTNCDKLSPDAFGALVSISYNRGWNGWQMDDNRHTEMAQIADAMDAEDFASVPGLIRAMKRLWPAGSGLRGRRDREAALFEASI